MVEPASPSSNSKPWTMVSWWLGWLGTGPYLLVFGLILVLFDPWLRLVHRLFGYRRHQEVIRFMNWCLYQSLWLNGCSISLKVPPRSFMAPSVKPDTAVRTAAAAPPHSDQNEGQPVRIFVVNHQSLNDIPPLIWKLRRHAPVLVSKAELASGIPSISYNFKVGGVVAIQRKNPESALQSMSALGQRMARRNENMLYFPEGTRARDGRIAPFKSGGLEQIMHRLTHFELVPIAVQNSWKLARWNFLPIPFGQCIRFNLLPSIPATGQDAKTLMQAAHHAISQHLQNTPMP